MYQFSLCQVSLSHTHIFKAQNVPTVKSEVVNVPFKNTVYMKGFDVKHNYHYSRAGADGKYC